MLDCGLSGARSIPFGPLRSRPLGFAIISSSRLSSAANASSIAFGRVGLRSAGSSGTDVRRAGCGVWREGLMPRRAGCGLATRRVGGGGLAARLVGGRGLAPRLAGGGGLVPRLAGGGLAALLGGRGLTALLGGRGLTALFTGTGGRGWRIGGGEIRCRFTGRDTSGVDILETGFAGGGGGGAGGAPGDISACLTRSDTVSQAHRGIF